MLHLRRHSPQLIGASRLCTSCLAVYYSPNAPAGQRSLYQYARPTRSFTTIPSRSGPEAEATPPDSSTAATPSTVKPPSAPKKKKKKKPIASNGINKDKISQDKVERQLLMLQGTLASLKKVLADQNIDVQNVVRSALPKQKDDGATRKPKSKSRSKPSTKGQKWKSKSSELQEDSPPVAEEQPSLPNVEAGEASPPEPGRKSLRKTAKARASQKSTVGKEDKAAIFSKVKGPKLVMKGKPTAADRTSKREAKKAALERLHGKAKAAVLGPLHPSNAISPVGSALPGTPALEDAEDSQTQESPLAETADGTELVAEPVINELDSGTMQLTPVAETPMTVPRLSYGLDRVLFNPGVYFLQDPRSKVYNFDPYLSKIMPVSEFDFNALPPYITSSKDEVLISMAKEHKRKYTGSTSSMSATLSHFHYLLSAWRPINFDMLSSGLDIESTQFTRIMRAPAATFLNWKDGTYAIDADKEYDTSNILAMLGKSMERLLTLPKDHYEKFRQGNSDQLTEEERNPVESYHYTTFEDFMLRSQLDAYDPRVPGTGMFDLKTRAVISIRMDANGLGYKKGLGYEIRDRLGNWESFEREYFDMIRSAFLKYSLQVRMGRMDGIFVAFHNTERIFGFQYVPISEMDLSLHGTSNTNLGDREFKLSLSLLNRLLDRATKRFPEKTLRLHFEARPSVTAPFMYVFAQPMEQDEVNTVQKTGQADIQAFENEILGITSDTTNVESASENKDVDDEITEKESQDEEMTALESEETEGEEATYEEEASSFAAWEEIRSAVEDAMNDDELGVGSVREAIQNALEQSGLLHARTAEEAQGYVSAMLVAITGEQHHVPVDATERDTTLLEEGEIDSGSSESDLDRATAREAFEAQLNLSRLEKEQEQRSVDKDASVASTDAVQDNDLRTSLGADLVKEVGDREGREQNEDHIFEKPADEVSPDEQQSSAFDMGVAAAASEVAPEPVEDALENSEEDENESPGTIDEDATSSSSLGTLKQLIVRMAQRQIGERPVHSERENESMTDDPSKLAKFERILAELISESKGPLVAPVSDMAGQSSEADGSRAEEESAASQNLDPDSSSAGEAEAAESDPLEHGELMGMVLTIRNKVNGRIVHRPKNLTEEDDWSVEYNIEELSEERARTLYSQIKNRRKVILTGTNRELEWARMFKGNLKRYTQRGRTFREQEDADAKSRPVEVYDREPAQWEEVFSTPDAPTKKE